MIPDWFAPTCCRGKRCLNTRLIEFCGPTVDFGHTVDLAHHRGLSSEPWTLVRGPRVGHVWNRGPRRGPFLATKKRPKWTRTVPWTFCGWPNMVNLGNFQSTLVNFGHFWPLFFPRRLFEKWQGGLNLGHHPAVDFRCHRGL